MLNLSLLNPQNYYHVGSFPVPIGKDLILPLKMQLSETMMVRWMIYHMGKDIDFLDLDDGLLISDIEIMGYGVVESNQFDISPSNFNTKRVKLIDLDLALPQKIIFRSSSTLVLNSALEFYAYKGDEDSDNPPNNMPSNNPVILDPAALTEAMISAAPELSQQIAAANQAATTAALQEEFHRETAKKNIDYDYTVTDWSTDPYNHLALQENRDRIEYTIVNRGNNDIYISVGDPGGKAFNNYLDVIKKGGTYLSTLENRTLPVLLYLSPNKPDQQVSITELVI